MFASLCHAQQAGSISGVVMDGDFDVPLSQATVTLLETGAKATTGSQGNYSFGALEPGTYTLMFSKSGFVRHVEADVLVSAGQVKEVNTSLAGDFTEMEEFIVQDLEISTGTAEGLLELRIESPALIDAVSADLLSQAGAGDAASGLRLVAGATTTDKGFAAVRGLPPRYVNTQLNGFMLPSADPETRSVQLDLFPSDIIDSIQVTKTFTPDQQGSASGGAVDIVTKAIPDQNFFRISSGTEYNTQRPGGNGFLRHGREMKHFGIDSSRRLPDELVGLASAPPSLDHRSFGNAAPTYGSAPMEYDWSIAGGLRHTFDTGVSIGGLATFFYEQDASHREHAINDSRVVSVANPGAGVIPDVSGSDAMGFLQTVDPDPDQVLTGLFDGTKSTQQVQWGTLATIGLEAEDHQVNLMFVHNRNTTASASIDDDTRGKQLKFPGHDPTALNTPGGAIDTTTGTDVRDFLPYRRLETLEYVERSVQSIQASGSHTMPFFKGGVGLDGVFSLLPPVFDWHVARSQSRRLEPGTRYFDSKYFSASTSSAVGDQRPVTFDGAGGQLGAYNVVFRDIEEQSTQYRVNAKFPFKQWTDTQGYVKFGWFGDTTTRDYGQNTFTVPQSTQSFVLLKDFYDVRLSEAFDDPEAYAGMFFDPFGGLIPGFASDRPGVLRPTPIDFTYTGRQEIGAWYWMVDLPLTDWVKVIGGFRYEDTAIATNIVPDGFTTSVFLDGPELLKIPGATLGTPVSVGLLGASALNADLRQNDMLPAIALVFEPLDGLVLRASYTQTIARPTFRELTPVSQSAFFGQTPFVGNPFLKMSAVENYDLRADYRPFPDTLFSVSWFKKDLTDPIQVVRQAQGSNSIVIPVNFPDGRIEGWEFEVRQNLGRLWVPLDGLTIGGNATLLDTEVTLRDFEADQLSRAGFPQSTVPMTDAPKYLYNLFMTYNVPDIGTTLSVFYTVRGDTLVTSPGVKADIGGMGGPPNFYIPAVFETEYGTLNLTLTQKLGKYVKLKFSAKNLLNPDIQTVYRENRLGGDTIKSSYKKGIDLSIGLSAEFTF